MIVRALLISRSSVRIVASRNSRRMASQVSLPSSMRAIEASAGECRIAERALPVLRPGEYLIRTRYTAINRADTLQRKGQYPPPPGTTDVLGLEVAGEVVSGSSSASVASPSEAAEDAVALALAGDAAAAPVTDATAAPFKQGDRVMALLAGGGNAEYVAVPSGQLMRIPSSMDWRSAAAIPETWLTAFQLLHFVGHARPGETIVVLAAASGVGTAAVQLAIGAGCNVVAVAGSDDKLAAVRKLADDTAAALSARGGAPGSIAATLNYKADAAWGKGVQTATKSKGAHVILDPVGGSFWRQTVDAFGQDGRWVLYGTMGGASVEGGIFAGMLRKRLTLTASTLRSRSEGYKAALTRAFAARVLPQFEAGIYKPVISAEFSLQEIGAAHKLMESNETIGKTVIRVA